MSACAGHLPAAPVARGCTVTIVGSGPIGLAALLTARFYTPAQIIVIDPDANRLEVALRFGATDVIDASKENVAARVMELTGGRGVDTAIEAVGVPASFVTCEDIVTPGGVIANIGVHGTKADLHLERLWDRNIAITTRLVDTVTTPMLLKTVESRKVDTNSSRTASGSTGYSMPTRPSATPPKRNALKVIIEV